MASRNCIAIASFKGGSGKTTVAACLAAELAARGSRVTLVDADPVGGLSLWGSAGRLREEVEIIANPTTSVADTVRQLTGTVIIDTAGAGTTTLSAALEVADLVLIPSRPSAGDAVRALETLELAKQVGKAVRRRIQARVVLVGVTRSPVVTHVRRELTAAGAKVLETEIGQRSAFVIAGFNGTAPVWLGYSGRQAAQEIRDLINEIDI